VTPTAATILLPFAGAVAIWVALSDMKEMKIPNKAVMALLGVWLAGGLGAVALGHLTLEAWAWGWALGAGALAAGIAVYAAGLVGAGDAKFVAAMAPFFVGADWIRVAALFSACLIGAFVLHRSARAIGPLRRATVDWKSWTHAKFPMGLALSGTLVLHLLLTILGSS
jgi:prepilin peptidase CpaA